MGMFRKLLFIIGLLLIALPFSPLFLPFDIIPQGSLVGINILSNDILSIILGVVLVIIAFWSWNRERKFYRGSFMGPRGIGDTQLMRRPTEAELRRMHDVQRLRALGA